MQITGLVLARGGSKGIPKKNCKDLCGTPLIGWTLSAALDWNGFESVWVSTDCDEVSRIAASYGASIHRRPANVSHDSTSSIEAALEFLEHHAEIQNLALLQCTSPCIQPLFLTQAYDMMAGGQFDSVFAVRKEHHLRWLGDHNGCLLKPLNFDPKNRPRRQDWNGELFECGMFYFARVEILKEGCFQGGKCGYVEIPKEYSLEIDTPFDWFVAETTVSKYGYHRLLVN